MEVDQNTRILLSGQYGEQAKFICQYIKCDLVSLESIVTADYDACFNAFVQSVHELVASLRRASSVAAAVPPGLIVKEIADAAVVVSAPVTVEDEDDLDLEIVEKTKKIKNKKMDKLLVEKWKTPLANRVNCVVKKPIYASPLVVEHQVPSEAAGTRKKRSAFAADISILNDESDEASDDIESETNSVKIKLFETKKKARGEQGVDLGQTDSDEMVANDGEQSSKNPSKKARLIEGVTVSSKKVKKSKKTKVEDVDMEMNGEEEATTIGALKSTKKGKTKKKKTTKSSKKANLENGTDLEGDQIEENAVLTETTSKKTKKVKKSKKTTPTPDEQEEAVEVEEPVVVVKKLTKVSNLYAKTPSRIDTGRNNTKTPSTLRISKSILRKSIRHSISKANGRPLTRRAAAEAAAKKTKLASSNAGYSNESVAVGENAMVKKPMNPVVSALRNGEAGMARNSPVKKLIGRFESISRTPGVVTPIKKKLELDTGTPKTNGRIKTKDPIEQRKQISSQAKLDAKRKSVKKAQQFLFSNVSSKQAPVSSNSPPQTNTQSDSTPTETTFQKKPSSPLLTQPETDSNTPQIYPETNNDILIIDVVYGSSPSSQTSQKPRQQRQQQKSTTPTRQKSSGLFVNTTTEEEQLLVDEILKSGECKVRVSRIPVGLMPINNQPVRISSASASAFLAEQHRRLTKEFIQPPKVTVNSLVYNPKTTPSKPAGTMSYTNLTGTGVKPNNGFAKFLERNTPSKITRTEIDEKRKAELLAKETKEKERLLEQKRMKHEKQEESKKKREEKLKKIQEVKQKQEMEREEKRKELERQASATSLNASKMTTSTSHNSIHKAGFLNGSILNKKPFVDLSAKLNVPSTNSSSTCQISKKLSAVDQEAISNFATQFGKYKQLQQQVSTDTEIIILKTDKDSNKYKDEYESSSLTKQLQNHHQNLETTYVLQSPPNPSLKPSSTNNQSLLKSIHKPGTSSYDVTPLQVPKLKDINNYDVSNLGSEDDTDDDEEPSKPIPDWAVQVRLITKVKQQNHSMVNFTRLFKSASQAEINLGDIFKTKRKKFTERSSSANWNCPPVWNGPGLTGEESFRILKE